MAHEHETRYARYLSDPSAIVEWKDVIEVVYTQPKELSSSQKTQCPICMEPAGFMVAPRVTKCGHLFCYACLLQYLDFEKQYAWKKCPLCAESIYKRDIRKATIVFDQDEPLTPALQTSTSSAASHGGISELQFRLVARNKSNIVIKRKIWLEHIDGTMPAQNVETSMTILEA